MELYDDGVEGNYIPPSAIEEIVLQTKADENAFIEQKQLANEDLSSVLLVFRLVQGHSLLNQIFTLIVLHLNRIIKLTC
jgi:hypothetical protein